jgi:predicted nucleic acid-binding protein
VIYVVDASAVIDLLVRSDPGERVRRWLAEDTEATLITVAHLDAEVFSGLARLHRAGELAANEVDELLRRLARLAVRRVPIGGALLDAAWRMRDNVAARDALYVAAARDLDCALLTTDQRLARAVPDLAIELNW